MDGVTMTIKLQNDNDLIMITLILNFFSFQSCCMALESLGYGARVIFSHF